MAGLRAEWTYPFRGRVVWLTPEQGGRRSGPPKVSTADTYAPTAFVPPSTVQSAASFVLRGFDPDVLASTAEGRWLIVENAGANLVQPGSIVACAEGPKVVAYFHVDEVVDVIAD